jgi:hypothetical protein
MRSYRTILILIAVAAILTACAGSSAALRPAAAQAEAGSGGNGAEAPTAAPSEAAGPVGAVDDARIVRTGTMQLEVTDVDRAVTAARAAIRGLGGYVCASTTSNEGDRPLARITYRIPVDRWEEALAALRAIDGPSTKVVVEQTEAVEVTGQIVDLEARIRNLRSSEVALQGIAAKAGKISDVLEVQAQLTTVRGEIEQLTAQVTELGNRADLATLTTSFATAVVPVQVAAEGWDPGAVAGEAAASMVDLLQALAGAGIWFAIVWLPILVVFAILGLGLAWALRRAGVLRRSMPPAT